MTDQQEQQTEIEVWVEDFLNELLETASLDLWIEELSIDDQDYLRVELGGEDAGIAIGRDGQGLEALQHLVVAAAIRKGLSPRRIIIDIEGYRHRREQRIQDEAERIADEVIKSGRSHELEPMNARERRIVHMTIANIDGVTTESFGDGSDRSVQVIPDRG